MGVEMLKLLLALGTGAFSVLIAYFANWLPPATTPPLTYAVAVAVVAAIKRLLDYLAAKTATPVNPTASIRR